MLERALALDPVQPDVMVNLGIHFQEEGDLDRARYLYSRRVIGPSDVCCATASLFFRSAAK